MRQIYLLLTFLVISTLSFAQTPKDYSDKKYLIGAVPEADGKVVFTHIIPLGLEAEATAFDKINEWHNKRYKDDSNRVLFLDKEKFQIVSLGHLPMLFKKSALYVDEATMIYQITTAIKDKNIETTISNIKFQYTELGKTDLHRAEEMITDKIAVKKNGKTLSRYYDKFRAHALDDIEEVFQSLDDLFDEESVGQVIPVREIPRQMRGYKQVGADKLPSNLTKLLSDQLALLSVNGKNMLIESGVLEVVDGQSVVRVTTHANFKADDVYTISFYTEIYRDGLNGDDLSPIRTPSGGGSFSEAWMIIECKRTKKDEPTYKIPSISGEVVNVWIK